MLADLEGGDPDESKPDVAPFRKAGDVLDGLLHDLEDLDREFDNISQGQSSLLQFWLAFSSIFLSHLTSDGICRSLGTG